MEEEVFKQILSNFSDKQLKALNNFLSGRSNYQTFKSYIQSITSITLGRLEDCLQRMKEEKQISEKESYEQQRVEDEEYFRKMNVEIDKNKERNDRFLSDNGFMSDYMELVKHIEEKPKELWRKDVGDEYFEASLTLSSCYNSLILGEFWRQHIDEVKIKWIFEQISNSLKSVGKKK